MLLWKCMEEAGMYVSMGHGDQEFCVERTGAEWASDTRVLSDHHPAESQLFGVKA